MSRTEAVMMPGPSAPSGGPHESSAAGAAQASAATLERLEAALETVRRRCPSLPLLAIRWMHLKHALHPVQQLLIREHLGMAGEGGGMVAQSTWPRLRWLRSMRAHRMVQCVVYALSVSARLLSLHGVLRRHVRALKREPFDLVIKTCGIGPARPADGRDFFFGDLQSRLTQRGLRTLVLCADSRGGDWIAFAKGHLAQPPLARLSAWTLVSPAAPLRLMVKQWMTSVRLCRLAATMTDPLVKQICRFASEDCLEPDTTRAGLSFWTGKAAVQAWRPRAFVTLYEGHASDLCTRWGVKAADASCRNVGYQHSMVFPESLALTSPSNPTAVRVVPDVVLTLGSIPSALVRPGHARHGARVVSFGSFRAHAARVKQAADPRRRVILVAPEGVISEIKALFEFAAACAKRLPAYTFLLRCHPETPMAEVAPHVSADLRTQPNIELSAHRRIEDDFARSSALLYRGSSVALHAVRHGLLPVYLHIPTMMDCDPLEQMPAWGRRCVSPDDLADRLDRHAQAPMERLEAEWSRAAQYVTDYIGPVGEAQIDAFLEAVGLRQTETEQIPTSMATEPIKRDRLPISPAVMASLDRLAQALATIRQRCPQPAVLAIRWMQLRQPVHPVQDALLDAEHGRGMPTGRFFLVRRLAACVVYGVYLACRIAALRLSLWRQIAALMRQRFDVIARTACFGPGRPADGSDFYYGDLQQRLARRGARMLLVCGDTQNGNAWRFARGHLVTSGICRMPELCLVPPLAPLRMMGQQLMASWRLLRIARTADDPLVRRAAKAASRDCLAPDTAMIGLLFWSAQEAVRIWGPRGVLTFHEGQAWESCVRLGVKTADPSCRTIGYQHTVILPVQFAGFRVHDDGRGVSRPDVVLGLGPRTTAMLAAIDPDINTVLFGTFRQMPRTQEGYRPRPQQRTILVVPETVVIEEAQALFNFAMRAARTLPEYHFIFRCHPIMTFERLHHHLDEDTAVLTNVEVSTAPSIVDDFSRASIALYRGSSSVLYGLLHGLKPVYLHVDELLDSDPLFELEGWRERVSTVPEFGRVLRRYAAASQVAPSEAWRTAVEYVAAYTMPVSEASLDGLLHALGLTPQAGAP